jgi:hypothetical protein
MVHNMRAHPEVRVKVFNLVMLPGYFPSCWKIHKTLLLPKDRDSPLNVSNCRWITIGSLLGRIYTGLVEFWLRRVTDFYPWQVGFMPVNVCSTNFFYECILQAKMKGTIVGNLADVAKAFDTLPPEATLGSLSSQSIDPYPYADQR